MSTPDQDVFSCILSHVHESKTVHAVLRALPQLHPLFPVALHRLWQLPVYLDHNTYAWRALVGSDEILDHLLAPDASEEALAITESIRHLVIAVEPAYIDNAFYNETDALAFRDRLSELFAKTRNLSRLEYNCYPGIPLSRENVKVLANCERLGTLRVDTAVRPTSDWEDPAPWDIEPFLADLAPSVTSLELRHVCMATLNVLLSHGDMLATYKNLEHLRMDITQGSWDWNGAGSPQFGASDVYTFPPLRLPALRRFELVVSDLTIHKARAGPLDLVDRTAITDLTLDITGGVYLDVTTIQLFMAIDLPMLSHLEVKDNLFANERVSWEPPAYSHQFDGRYCHGLVEGFLPSSSHLTSLWVDERALLPARAENDRWVANSNFAACKNCGIATLPISTPWTRLPGGQHFTQPFRASRASGWASEFLTIPTWGSS
ncbi:hypothetical protein C8R46DRAFT_380454 [Mycena filopes]|nr:hypothetical protein C8R46DRAFT_380454 [Mycena filopes]